MPIKDWLFVIGVAVAVFVGFVVLYEPEKDPFGPSRKGTSGILAGYGVAVLDLACVVNFPDWRRGLVDLGLPEALSWVLAPIGLMVVIAASLVSWSATYGELEESAWWQWLGADAFYIAALAGYLLVLNR